MADPASAIRARPGIRRLLERRRAAWWRVRRCGRADRAARPRDRAAARRPGRLGRRIGAAAADRLPLDRAARRPGSEQAVAPRAPRPGVEITWHGWVEVHPE